MCRALASPCTATSALFGKPRVFGSAGTVLVFGQPASRGTLRMKGKPRHSSCTRLSEHSYLIRSIRSIHAVQGSGCLGTPVNYWWGAVQPHFDLIAASPNVRDSARYTWPSVSVGAADHPTLQCPNSPHFFDACTRLATPSCSYFVTDQGSRQAERPARSQFAQEGNRFERSQSPTLH
jgi:hypothetical protein